jgi:uncharacterized protein YjbI with pentapeptide repeats
MMEQGRTFQKSLVTGKKIRLCPRLAQAGMEYGLHGFAGIGIFQPGCAMRVLIAALFILSSSAVFAMEKAPSYDAAAVAKIHGGIVDCVGCNLKGADLTNTCVKAHDLTGADFDGANATLMCMSFANFTKASFRGTDLSAANLAGAKMDGADLTGARLSITSFLGTDLSRAKGLTQAQLNLACGDAKTKLPAGLKVHTCQ